MRHLGSESFLRLALSVLVNNDTGPSGSCELRACPMWGSFARHAGGARGFRESQNPGAVSTTARHSLCHRVSPRAMRVLCLRQ